MLGQKMRILNGVHLMKNKNVEIEVRQIAEVRLEARGEEPPKIIGYAAVFDSLSKDLGGFREKIDRGAFATSLKEGDEVHALFNHDSDKLLGRRGAGTLELWEDDRGLKVEINPPDTSDGRDVVELLRRGDLMSMSFGFYNVKDNWETREGEDIRTIEEARLFDVSIVVNPAYNETSVGVRCEPAMRSLEEYKNEIIKNTDFDSLGEQMMLRQKLRIYESET